MASLLSGTTIGGHVAVHANNISTYALTSVPSNVITTSGGQTIGGTTYFSGGESLNLYGIRGRFTNEYIHLYNKVGIGHPSGWGEGQGNTPVYGLSTYGGINVGYGYDGQAVFNTYTRINYNWGGGTYGTEAFTIRGTYPSIALRSTTHDNKWLIHNASNLQYYYGASVDNNDWGKKIEFATDGNIWSAYYNDWLSNVLANKQNSSTAITTSNIGSQSVNYAASAGNADTVDGRHADYFYPGFTDNGYSTGDINGSGTHQRLWGTDSVQNLLAFRPPTSIEYSTDGVNWTATTATTGLWDNKMFGKWGGFNMAVGNNVGGWRYVRMTWVNFGYHFFSHFTLAHSTNGHSFNFVFQKSDLNGVFSGEAFRQNGIGSWPGYTFTKHSNVSGWWDTRDIRFVFELNHNNDYPNNSISVGHIGLMGGYSGFTRLYDWDADRNMFFGGVVYAATGNSNNWNTAFGWGNHASAGYQAAATAITTSNIGSQSVSYADESGYSGSTGSVEWTNVQNKPATFPPSTHNHDDRYYTESESDGRFLIGTTNPNSVANFTISIGNNGSYSYVQSHSGQPLYLNPVGNAIYLNSTTTVAGTAQFNSNTTWFSGRATIGLENQSEFARFAFYGLSLWDWDHGEQMVVDGNYVYVNNYLQAGNSLRAPIFYDSQDTAYYVDPNSTSNILATYIGRVLINHDGTDTWFRMQSGNRMRITTTGGTDFIIPNTGEMTYNGNTVIHTGNIGSQSVSYASSAGNADTVDGYHVGNSTNQIAYWDGSRNLFVNNPESYSGEVRLGAAWGRGGVYTAGTHSVSTGGGAIDFVSNDNIIGAFRWDSTNGTRFIVGQNVNTTPYTLIDSNKRPVIYQRGAYPVLTLDHTVSDNTRHGPTIQFVHDGPSTNNRQWVIGTNGTGTRLDFGYSDGSNNTSFNPHNGIDDYQGTTWMRLDSGGTLSKLGAVALRNGFTISQGGANYGHFNSWVFLSGAHGFYTGVNGAHLYPNDANYGSWRISGTRNGWNGIEFDASNGNVSLMVLGSGGTTGFHNNSHGWQVRWATGTLYVSKNTYGGNEATVLDSSNYATWAQPASTAINTGNIGSQSVNYATSAGNADTVDSLHASSFLRSDTYNSNYGGLQVFRNIGTIDGSWPDSDHTFGLENSDAGNIVVNFHRAGYTSHNLWYNGSQFRFDQVVTSTADMRAPIFYDSNNTAYYGDFASSGTSVSINGGIVTTAPGGSVLLKHAVSEVDAWIFQENAANWGLYWKNNPSGNHTFGGYTTVGAELFGMSAANVSGNGVLTTNFVGATSAYAQYMLSNYTGYIWSASTIFAAGDMRAPIFYDSNNTNRYLDLNSTAADAMIISGGIHISRDNVTGNGIILADDGDIVDLNDAYCSMRFSYGVRIFSANRGGSPVHTLHSDGNAYFNTSAQTPIFLVTSHSDNTKGYRIYNTSNSSVSAMFTNSANALVIGAGAFDQVQLNKKVLVSGAALGVNVAASATAGRIDASNDIVAYSSSDERLKHNITPIENALDKVKSLTGVEFDWKPEYKHAHGYEGHDTGIIAQQVQEVIPSAVRTNDTGFLAVRYEKLIGLLIEANKELAARVEELEKKLG
jgi:hypothetical protein